LLASTDPEVLAMVDVPRRQAERLALTAAVAELEEATGSRSRAPAS
jgi:hypothetical protein